MGLPFQDQHGAMLLKYSGISFISGSVNHGFFSGERSLWTAATGIVLFVLGLWLENRRLARPDRHDTLWNTVLWGTLLSVGLGFFTGGLQHFPDSPDRSAWVVPLGFAISVVALLVQQQGRGTRATATYVAVAGAVVLTGSVGAWQWLDRNPAQDVAHRHGEDGTTAARPLAQVVSRTIEVGMSDEMRFLPGTVQVRAGETVRILARNDGRLPHELVIGTEDELREHAATMRSSAASHSHPGGAAITVEPGRTGELVVTYPRPAQLQIACLVPGHYEAGMRGRFDVVAQVDTAGVPADTRPKTAPPRNLEHGDHKHP